MKSLLTIFLITVSASILAQQGANFSMWYLNNNLHNPAAIGTNNADMKLFSNFRYQYFTVSDKPNRSISAALETKILKSERGHYLGLGVNFLNDATGYSKYTVNELAVPIAYHIAMNENNSLAIGISPGFYNRNIGNEDLTWEHQWNGSSFMPNVPGETRAEISKNNSFNLSAGLFYKYERTITNKFYFGFSVNHIIGQNVGFTINDELSRSFTGQFGMTHRFKDRDWGISPNAYAMVQGENLNVIFGTNFDFYLVDGSRSTIFIAPNSISFGVYHRLFEGIIVNVIGQFEGATIAVSYDTNINSMIKHSKSVGAFEIAVSYDIIFNKRQKYIW